MKWIRENKIVSIIILALVVVLIYTYSTKQQNTQAKQFNGVIYNKFKKNVALESVYKNSTQLPKHNTVCFPTKNICVIV